MTAPNIYSHPSESKALARGVLAHFPSSKFTPNKKYTLWKTHEMVATFPNVAIASILGALSRGITIT